MSPVVSETKPKDDEVLEAASGSGFAVSSDGYVITNNHIIEGYQEVAVYDGGRAVPVTVITYDLQNDLALMEGDFTPQTVFALSGDQPELLQDIYLAGYPFGNEVSSSIKVTKGRAGGQQPQMGLTVADSRGGEAWGGPCAEVYVENCRHPTGGYGRKVHVIWTQQIFLPN